MKLLNWIKNLFKKESPKTEAPSKPNPSETPSSSKKLKIAIVRGHGGKDGGASGCGTTEVEYNTWVMKEIEKLNLPNVKCFYGSSSINAVLQTIPYNPDLTIQLHLNAYNGQAKGCVCLVLDGDTKSYPFAEKFVSSFTEKFNRVTRNPSQKGKALLKSSDRGYTSLKTTVFGAKILVEPFFIDNKNDFVSKEEYAEFLIEYIKGI